MSYNKELAINILKQIEKAILLIQSRTSEIHSASDFLTNPGNVEKNELKPLLNSVRTFIDKLSL